MKLIATWKMSYLAMKEAQKSSLDDKSILDTIETIITKIEDEPTFHSVGYGGLPNKIGVVELDAAFMDGTTLRYGAVAGVHDIKNPIKVARSILKNNCNNLLVGAGAEKYAQENDFEFRNLLTIEAKEIWQKRIAEETPLAAYDGHDTVCVIGLDTIGNMGVGVSTSGLFMKFPGRVGDSPVIGSGFYCDSQVGGAAATGLGEDIMRGCLAIRVVEKMKEGIHPQEACQLILNSHLERLNLTGYQIGGISLIAMNKEGDCGVATNEKEFPFVITTEENTILYSAQSIAGKTIITEKDETWIKNYLGD